MLRVGLSGGIGSGKSTVAGRLVELGAVLIDADVIAREVVRPGRPAWTAIRERFGDGVIDPDGALDRPELGRVVFADPAALRDLEAITHPAIWGEAARQFATAPHDAVVVHDMPLLVEKGMVAQYHLTVIVDTEEERRVARLVRSRGMTREDARARINAQADDAQRRAAADVLLGNNGSPRELLGAVDRLWHQRLVPYEANLRGGVRVRRPQRVHLVQDPAWTDTGRRLATRIGRALGAAAQRVDHIGSTAVPGLLAKDVIDLQVGVRALEVADDAGFGRAMASAGYVRVPEISADNAKDGAVWAKRFFGGCDPGRVAHVHVREVGAPGWRWALMFRDWLRADATARADYARVKRQLVARSGEVDDGGRGRGGPARPTEVAVDYAEAKEPWFDDVDARVRAWAAASDWHPQAPTDLETG